MARIKNEAALRRRIAKAHRRIAAGKRSRREAAGLVDEREIAVRLERLLERGT